MIDGPTTPLRVNKSIRAGKGLNLNDGGGLLMTASDARRMLANRPHLEPWLGPWITSAIVGQTPGEAKDYAIDLTGLSETEARQVAPELLELAERTKDHRSGLPPSKQRVKDKWWLPEAQARALSDWLAEMPSSGTHVPVMAQTCKGAIPTMAPVTSKFSQDVFVFAEPDSWWWFGILASYPHQLWLLQFGSRTAGGTPRYGGKTMLETFPFDAFRLIPIQDDAKALWESLQSLMADRGFGVSGAVEEVAAGASVAVDGCRAAWASINDRLMRAPGSASHLQIDEFVHGPFASSAGPRFWPAVSHEEVLDALLRIAYGLAAKERGVSVDTVMKQVGNA